MAAVQWLRLLPLVAAALAIFASRWPSAQATCGMFLSSLSRLLPAQQMDVRCRCEQPDMLAYVLQCSMPSLPCPTGGASSAAGALAAEAWDSSGDPSQLGTVVLNFSRSSIAELQRGCLAAYVRHVNGAHEELVLDLAGNAIETLAAAAFAGVEAYLRVLNISGNRLRQLAGKREGNGGDGRGPFAQLRLRSLDLSANRIVSPCGLHFRQATSLRLDGNEITTLEPDCFRPSPGGIASLDLSRNAIASIDESAFKGVKGLAELLLADNRLMAADDGAGEGEDDRDDAVPWMQHLDGLQRLDLSGNRLSSIGQLCRTPALCTVQRLDLRRNGIRLVKPYCFKSQASGRGGGSRGGVGNVGGAGDSLPPPLELRLDENELSSLGEHALAGLERRLATLGLASNRLVSIGATALRGMSRLRSIDLSGNALADLSWLCALDAPSLRELTVRRNALAALLPDARRRPNCLVGLNLSGLRSLDASGNRLRELAGGELAALAPGIETLDLSDNELVALRAGALAGLAQLRRLRLSGNRLARLGACAFVGPWLSQMPLPTAAAPKLVELHYGDNPLHCDDGCGGGANSRWLQQLASAVGWRGAGDPSVAVPVRHAVCVWPAASRGLSVDRLPSGGSEGCQQQPNATRRPLLPLVKELCGDLRVTPRVVANDTLSLSWVGFADGRGESAYVDVRRVGEAPMVWRLEPVASSNGTYETLVELPDGGGSSFAYELCATVVQSDDGAWQHDCTVFPKLPRRQAGGGGGGQAATAANRWRAPAELADDTAAAAADAGILSGDGGAVAAAATLAVLIVLVVGGSVLLIWLLHRKHRKVLEKCKPLSELRIREAKNKSLSSFSMATLSTRPYVAGDATDGSSSGSLLQGSITPSSGGGGGTPSSGGLSLECGYIKEWTPMRRVVLDDYL